MLYLGREYIQLAILIIIRVFSTLMAPVGMNQLLRYAFFFIISTHIPSASPPVTSKITAKGPLFDHGFGLRTFS